MKRATAQAHCGTCWKLVESIYVIPPGPNLLKEVSEMTVFETYKFSGDGHDQSWCMMAHSLRSFSPSALAPPCGFGFRSTSPLGMNPNIASEGSFDPFSSSLWTKFDGQLLAAFSPTTMTGPDEYDFQSGIQVGPFIDTRVETRRDHGRGMTGDPILNCASSPGTDLTLFTSVLKADSIIHDAPVSSHNPPTSDNTTLNPDGKPLPTSSRALRQTNLNDKHLKVKEAKPDLTTSSAFNVCGVQRSFPRRSSRASKSNKALKTEDEPDLLSLDFASDLTQPTGKNIVQRSSSDGPAKELPSQYSTDRDEEGRRIYQCFTCPDIRTRNFGDMRRHLDSRRHQDPSYRCVPGCSKTFTRRDALVRHIRTQHKDEARNIAVNDKKEAFFLVEETRKNRLRWFMRMS